jgi:RNA polymerase sigma-70 factor (ECF subfamily)
MDAFTTIRLPEIPGNEDQDRDGSLALASTPTCIDLDGKVADEVLMAQLGEGNREALAVLFRRHARTVRAIAYRAVRDASEADDLVQDVFLLVHRDAKAFDSGKGTARSWIFQIAHRRGISRHRYLTSRHFYQQVDLDNMATELEDPQANPQHANLIREMFGEADFAKVLAELSQNQRETLRLHFFEGHTFAEIATKLGQSRGNIKHHYFRGLEKLRKRLFGGKLYGNDACTNSGHQRCR